MAPALKYFLHIDFAECTRCDCLEVALFPIDTELFGNIYLAGTYLSNDVPR
jgi:hypothetical protein